MLRCAMQNDASVQYSVQRQEGRERPDQKMVGPGQAVFLRLFKLFRSASEPTSAPSPLLDDDVAPIGEGGDRIWISSSESCVKSSVSTRLRFLLVVAVKLN